MIKVNLISIRQSRRQEIARLDLILGALAALFAVGVGLVGWGFAWAYLTSIQADTAQLQKDLDAAKADVLRVDEMEKIKAELQRKLDVIADLRAQRVGPVHVLDDLTVATPERLTLTSVVEKGGAVEIEGYSVSNEIISQFLRGLEASDYFEQVYLKDIEQVKDNKQRNKDPIQASLKKFKLTARIVTPGSTGASNDPDGTTPTKGTKNAPNQKAPAQKSGTTGGATEGSGAAAPTDAAPTDAAPTGAAPADAAPTGAAATGGTAPAGETKTEKGAGQ